ncbi:MAG: hypothetical protein JJE40_10285 [Vicinamibacteria bacterium]|nr:hypothetical protein [Vicinamibacteria bacterium]
MRRTGFAWCVEALGAGLLLGIGARLAMRVLSWLARTASGFSTGGSVEIVVFGALLGLKSVARSLTSSARAEWRA